MTYDDGISTCKKQDENAHSNFLPLPPVKSWRTELSFVSFDAKEAQSNLIPQPSNTNNCKTNSNIKMWFCHNGGSI